MSDSIPHVFKPRKTYENWDLSIRNSRMRREQQQTAYELEARKDDPIYQEFRRKMDENNALLQKGLKEMMEKGIDPVEAMLEREGMLDLLKDN